MAKSSVGLRARVSRARGRRRKEPTNRAERAFNDVKQFASDTGDRLFSRSCDRKGATKKVSAKRTAAARERSGRKRQGEAKKVAAGRIRRARQQQDAAKKAARGRGTKMSETAPRQARATYGIAPGYLTLSVGPPGLSSAVGSSAVSESAKLAATPGTATFRRSQSQVVGRSFGERHVARCAGDPRSRRACHLPCRGDGGRPRYPTSNLASAFATCHNDGQGEGV